MKTVLLVLAAIAGPAHITAACGSGAYLFMPSKKSDYAPDEDENEALKLAKKLSEMIKCDTTSHAGVSEIEKFEQFHTVLERLFPTVHQKLERTDIDGNRSITGRERAAKSPFFL